MRKGVFLATAALALASAAARAETAAGFIDWKNVDDKHKIWTISRAISASDLRNRVAIVVEIDGSSAESIVKGLKFAEPFIYQIPEPKFGGWQEPFIKHPPWMTVVSVRGGEKHPEEFAKAMKTVAAEKKFYEQFTVRKVPIYAGVTFDGAPAAERPFAYVAGPDGTEAKKIASPSDPAVAEAKKKAKALGKWERFLGYVREPKHFPSVAKALQAEKPKPLSAEIAKLKQGLKAREPEKAREAQMLLDAIEQTKLEDSLALQMLVYLPDAWCTGYVANEHFARFPQEKSRLAAVFKKMQTVPEIKKFTPVVTNLAKWSDPQFAPKNEAEAKRIVSQLNGMKRLVSSMEQSKNMAVQGGAMQLSGVVDELIETIPARVAK